MRPGTVATTRYQYTWLALSTSIPNIRRLEPGRSDGGTRTSHKQQPSIKTTKAHTHTACIHVYHDECHCHTYTNLHQFGNRPNLHTPLAYTSYNGQLVPRLKPGIWYWSSDNHVNHIIGHATIPKNLTHKIKQGFKPLTSCNKCVLFVVLLTCYSRVCTLAITSTWFLYHPPTQLGTSTQTRFGGGTNLVNLGYPSTLC